MHSLLARLGALALTAAALGGCASSPPDAAQLAGRDSADQSATTNQPATLDGEIRQAQLLRAQGDYPGAIHVLSQLMLVNPDDPRVVGEYGKVLLQQGRAGEAASFLKRAVELQPGDWTVASALGVSYDQLGDYANARQAYDRALTLKPGEAVVLNNYAMSRMLAGDLVQAHALIAQAAAASNDPKIARNQALVNGLLPAASPRSDAATVPALASAAPPATVTTATHAPKSLATVQTGGATVVMQAVPVDPKAGVVPPKKAIARAAHGPRKLAASPKLRPTAAHEIPAHDSKVPSLRLAGDGA